MDFGLGEASEVFRAQARAFLDATFTPEIEERCHRSGVSHDEGFVAAMREQGWLAPGWPVEYGGQGRDPMEVLAFSEEMQRVGAPSYALATTLMIAGVIRVAGTRAQKQEILPKALAGEIIIVLGFTEPENGSDAAAAKTRAVRTGDGWTITGQKMFTTNAHIGDYVFLLARTNPDAKKHHGLTTFLVPMKQPGVEVQAVFTLSGERTNITFYNDVYVSDEYRIGEVDGGWQVMAIALGLEHSAGFTGESQRLMDQIERWLLTATDGDGRPRRDEPGVRERVGRATTEIEVGQLLQRRSAWLQEIGRVELAHGSMAKLFSTERLERQAADMLEMLGPDGLRSWGEETAPMGGRVEHAVRNAKGTTIYAGTSEIHRGIIAQHGLRLPRAR